MPGRKSRLGGALMVELTAASVCYSHELMGQAILPVQLLRNAADGFQCGAYNRASTLFTCIFLATIKRAVFSVTKRLLLLAEARNWRAVVKIQTFVW